MGHSEIESPLLHEGDIERNQDYGSLPETTTGKDVQLVSPSHKGRTVLFAVGICCIAALLLVSATFVSYTLQTQTEGVDGDGGLAPYDNAEFLKQQRLAFHFRPERNYMSGMFAHANRAFVLASGVA
jgi:hypothetical protein